ncbi:SDR family NAD(P)-dependent oxidoreductase [Teichococcus aestuarii]|uniref:Oxidoreductase n=1 Tax=Teichococcus aestuarii TaxID=568898 RepID=A0A2U1V585_9PROT|nr:SDR family NAD(P)-dependent oxidoreductase [Pseudoroseomonas aestuarii]PWC29079.1 oxidoreductase [Pseudoroseomonas aestuarii]
MAGKPLAGQVALVTGASRGLGAALALELARRGAHCVLVARTQGGLEETDDAIRAEGGSATLLPFDLAGKEADKIDSFGPSLVERFGRLDILAHVAGALGSLTPVAHIQPRDWTQLVGVNMNATWRLIRTCDPPLRAAPAGRAVFVTTGRVQRPKPYWGPYGATKAGMEHLVKTWAMEVAESRLRVNLFDPDVVATKMRAQAMPGEDPATIAQPADVAPALADLCMPAETRQGETVLFRR